MNSTKMHCFEIAAKYESITKAAEELFIPQPTVSKHIRSLEAELGYQLFDRHGKHIYLNGNGEIFLRYVKKFKNLLQDCKKELTDQAQNVEGEVSLLVASCSKILPDILQQFCKAYPNIKLYINQSDFPHMDADLNLFSQNDRMDCSGGNCIQLLQESIFLAVPWNHPLTDQTSVSLSDLRNEKFIMLKQKSNLRKIVDPFFQKQEFRPNIIMEAENPSLLRELIASGFGISVMPTITWGEASSMQIKLIPFKEFNLQRSIYLSWDKKRYLSRSARQLRDFIRDYFANLVCFVSR